MKRITKVHAEAARGRTVCGHRGLASNRLTRIVGRVNCKRCLQLMEPGKLGPRKPPKRVEPVGSKPLHDHGRRLGRDLAALMGYEPPPPSQTYNTALRIADSFNRALNFALDTLGVEGTTFLRMWREGDWAGIAKEFPEFDKPYTVSCNPPPIEFVPTPPKLSPGKITVDEAQLDKLTAVYKLASELCDAIDAAEEDIGGCRDTRTILGELGPAVDAVKPR